MIARSPLGRAAAIAAVLAGLGCTPSDAPSRRAEAPVTPKPSEEPTRASESVEVVEILAAAKKRLAADRAVLQNDPGVERALERQRRQRVDSGMAARLVAPGTSAEALAAMAREAAEGAGLVTLAVTVAEPTPAAPVPREHHGDAPYAYAREQLFRRFALTLELGRAGPKDVSAWLAKVVERGEPLPFVEDIEPRGADLIVTGHYLMEVDVTPPRHVISAIDVASLARAAGVEPPPPEAFGADERATLDALIAEYRALLPKLDQALALLGESHLEAERFRFYRQAAAHIDEVLGEEGRDEHP